MSFVIVKEAAIILASYSIVETTPYYFKIVPGTTTKTTPCKLYA